MRYEPDECLMISGLQHFRFCRRQWALIHIEQQWADNLRTVDGDIMHERAHNESLKESRGDTIIMRGLRVYSSELGLTGQCDVVEFRRAADGITLADSEGLWLPYPIEYKRGHPKNDECDELQLCAQAMCLEEMLCCRIEKGALYYGELRRRAPVEFTEDLRREVSEEAKQMHELFRRGHTPKVKLSKSCNACSLKNLCLPRLSRTCAVNEYIHQNMEATDEETP